MYHRTWVVGSDLVYMRIWCEFASNLRVATHLSSQVQSLIAVWHIPAGLLRLAAEGDHVALSLRVPCTGTEGLTASSTHACAALWRCASLVTQICRITSDNKSVCQGLPAQELLLNMSQWQQDYI